MTAKTNAIVATIIVLVFLFIAIVIKIKNDKKRKSLTIQFTGTIKPKEKKSFFAEIPSAVLAIITVVAAIIVLFGIGEGLGSLIKFRGGMGEAIPYILYDLVIACCCYFIVKQNPGSIWYVPVICNVLGIISAIVEPNFWITPMWILVCGGWILSIIASIIGVRAGRRMHVSDYQ
jgi:protein-S-isoprenylcysteine O-methyltransferase Ste14